MRKVAVIGAGPVGCVLSLMLAEQGYTIDLYEKRVIDYECPRATNGRNRQFAVHRRGMHALAEVGITSD